MRIFSTKGLGFTIIELMVVVFIIAVASVIGGISIQSRMEVSRLEDAAQKLADDLSAARTTAIVGECPIRFVICEDNTCSGGSAHDSNISSGSFGTTPNLILDSGGDPARYYGILKMYSDSSVGPNSRSLCEESAGKPAELGDGWDWWDHDRRPQAIPKGIAFHAIYDTTSNYPVFDDNDVDGTTVTDNAIWFNNVDGVFTVPVSSGLDSEGDTIAFQLQFDHCDPTSSSDDCLAFIITVSAGGSVDIRKCTSGGRSDGTNTCF